jgi:hypothetical protein
LSRISVIPVPGTGYALKSTACFDVSHSNAHTRGWKANFRRHHLREREFAVNTLRKLKSAKTILTNKRFVQITKSMQDPGVGVTAIFLPTTAFSIIPFLPNFSRWSLQCNLIIDGIQTTCGKQPHTLTGC